jgi:protein-disulfide isomerase
MTFFPLHADRRKTVAAIFLALFCVLAVQAGRARTTPPGVASPSKRVLARSKGNPGSALWVVEYMDFQCQNCREAAPLIDGYMKAHPGAIYFEARFLPLIRLHRYALKSAIYAECAARHGRFWPMHDLLFAKQEEWGAVADPDALFADYAREAGLDAGRLSACVSDPAVKAAVIEEKDRARSLGLTATPSFFVNGKQVLGVQALREEMDAYFGERKAS